jgi:glycosyltransferase involved in cell wall biosynthesis
LSTGKSSLTEKVLIAIPAFNEAVTIGTLLLDIKNRYPDLDILVIDDGSSDQTAEIAGDHDCFLVRNHNNQGKGSALVQSFEFAQQNNYTWAITLDADLQHPVSSIADFLDEISNGYADLILANRRDRTEKMPFHRQLSNGTTSIMISLIAHSRRIKDSQCGFRAYRVLNLKNLDKLVGGFQFESEILINLAKKQCRFSEVEIPTVYNQQKSSINLVNDTFLFIKFIISCILRS